MSGLNVQFGSGVVTIIPNAGNLAANPTPIRLKVLQEASVEFKSDLKKLFGQSQFPVATARGKIEVTGKMKIAAYDANDINQIYWGQQVTTGGAQVTVDEPHALAASVVISASTAVTADLGVIDAATGKNLTRVTGTPAAGQYAVAISSGTATYTFYATDTITNVKITYAATVAAGKTLTMANQLMGYAPVCQLTLTNAFRGNQLTLVLNSVTLGMLSFPTKQEDFWVADVDFSANTDSSDTLGSVYTT